ncbi:hypothetical protein [Derxia lacustris]|uniref:hypothetical protein n=1 Tax=Derxia lacustris TaxID=764842 RepID=UPI000A1734DC|nr:hypothetical protein [Derxia lacustris]
MSFFHGVVRLDHHSAQLLRFDAERMESAQLADHPHATRQHHGEVRSEHEFFGSVCDALDGIGEVLVTGGHTALNDFRHYSAKHRPQLGPHLVGWEPVDHPTEGELLAFARRFFVRRGRLNGTPAGI